MSIRDEETEACEALEATGNYRILRRIPKWQNVEPPESTRGLKIGLMVDVETTGLDYKVGQIIEFGAVMFSYGPDGKIYSLSEPYHSFNDPGMPIPPAISTLTGITDDIVRGHKLDLKEIDEMFTLSNFVIAFHAAFDRKFCERITMNAGTKKPWGCAMSQVPWTEEGIAGTRLAYIAQAYGYFYEAHRAVDDCLAAIHLLSLPLPKSGTVALSALRANALKPGHRVWAENSPYSKKDELKARGYRWNDGSNFKEKCWLKEVAAEEIEAEKRYLIDEIYCRDVPIKVDQVTIYDRFSVRE